MKLSEAKHMSAGTFDSLMLNFFKKVSDEWVSDEDPRYEDTFAHLWIPKENVFPWYTEIDIRGSDWSVDEQISFIGQDPKHKDQIWVEYEVDDRSNGDWMNRDHFMRHVVIRDERGFRIAP